MRAGFVAVLLLAGLAALRLWLLCRASASLPLWDEAAHGFAGVQVADALRHFSPIELALALNRQVVWPFVHSLMLAPAFLIGGNGIASAEAVSVALYAATVVLLFFAGLELHPSRGPWVGLAAATLALLAPEWRVFGTLVMLEMPGAFLLTLAFVLHARAARAPLDPRRLGAAGIATTALFLCKYNYGLTWLAAVSVWEWSLLPEAFRRRAWAHLRARLLSPRWMLRPMPLIFAIGGLATAIILATGGGEIAIAGRHVSMRTPGSLAYALWLAWLLWMFVPQRAAPIAVEGERASAAPRTSRAARAWAQLPDRARVLMRTVALPLAVWFTLPYPNRVREFFGFISNRDSGLPLWRLDGLLFYPRALAADYSPSAWVAWIAIALALCPPIGRRRGEPAWLAWLAFVVALAATVAHRYRESRFFFTVMPLLWLCAAHTLVAMADALLRRVPARPIREGAWLAAGAALIAAAWLAAPTDSSLRERRALLRGPSTLQPALDAVLDATDAARRDHPEARVVLLGYSNLLSPGLLTWRARAARPEWSAAWIPKRAPYLAAGADEPSLAMRLRWLESHADRVIVVLADPATPGMAGEYSQEVWADRETVERMREDPARWAPQPAVVVSGFRVEPFASGGRR